MLTKTNVEKKLIQLRDKQFDPSTWKQQVQSIFEPEEMEQKRNNNVIEDSLFLETNKFILAHLETEKIYHIDQIKRICIDYRLRFLDVKYFKGTIPKEAHNHIKKIEKLHQTTLADFKIAAPSKLFKLANADDPLLFAPIGNDYYYLLHKWGNDLHPFRKLMMWFFKSFENLLILTFIVSLLITFILPLGLFTKENNITTFMLVLFFMFKSVAAVVLFYGFALGKNFNTAIWNSKYFNA